MRMIRRSLGAVFFFAIGLWLVASPAEAESLVAPYVAREDGPPIFEPARANRSPGMAVPENWGSRDAASASQASPAADPLSRAPQPPLATATAIVGESNVSRLVLLGAYCASIVAVSLLGGGLPSLIRLTHTRMQLMISLVGGLMLGIGVFHLYPHALAELGPGQIDVAALWLMAGLLTMFFLLRAFHFHQHEAGPLDAQAAAPSSLHAHNDHTHDCGHDHDGSGHARTRASAHQLSWIGVFVGLSLHTMIDGAALAASVEAEAADAAGWGLFGLGTYAAVLLHKPLDAVSITSLMRAGRWSGRAMLLTNAAFAMMCPLGAGLFVYGVHHWTGEPAQAVGCALAFAAGVFLCIALSDLLPEMELHSHHRVPLTAALLLGIAVAWGIRYLEPAHAHQHHDGQRRSFQLPVPGAGGLASTELAWSEQLAAAREGRTTAVVVDARLVSPDEFRQLGDGCQALETLEIGQADIPDDALVVLAALPKLKRLRLGAPLGDDGLERIAAAHSLEIVNLADARCTDAGLAGLAALPRLRLLRLGSPRVTDAGLAHVAGMKSLRFLHLIGVPITDAGLAALSGMTWLESFYLDGGNCTDAGLRRLLAALPELHFHRDQLHLEGDPHAHRH